MDGGLGVRDKLSYDDYDGVCDELELGGTRVMGGWMNM